MVGIAIRRDPVVMDDGEVFPQRVDLRPVYLEQGAGLREGLKNFGAGQVFPALLLSGFRRGQRGEEPRPPCNRKG